MFSKGLVPGPTAISYKQITRRWERHVKDELGITADFYAFKHHNSTETSDAHGQEAAAAQNSHTSTAMVRKIYDVNDQVRNHGYLKQVGNSFS